MKKWVNGDYVEMTEEELAKMQAEEEQRERAEWLNITYGDAVNNEVRRKYSQQAVEAIINNYLADPTNAEHVREFFELQEYREQCKAYVKEMFAKYGRTVETDGI